MMELFQQAMLPANLPYSILLMLIMVYWLTVILGVLDLEFLDIDLDMEVDADIDVDIELDAEVEADMEGGTGLGWFSSTLSFFNIGSVPFMIFASFLILSLWTVSVIANGNWGSAYRWLPLALILPNIVFSLLVTKALTWPFKGSYQKMNKQGISKRELVGKMCKVTVGVSPGQKGQAELTFDEQHFLLNIRAKDDTIGKGNQALIIEYDPEHNYFWVTPFDL